MRILLIGFGARGGGLLKGWKPFYDVTIVDPFKQDCAKSVEELPANYCPDVAIIAVKPQVLDKVLPAYAKFADTLFISIAAGITIAAMEARLPPTTKGIFVKKLSVSSTMGAGVRIDSASLV